jgi:hypothetical protein
VEAGCALEAGLKSEQREGEQRCTDLRLQLHESETAREALQTSFLQIEEKLCSFEREVTLLEDSYTTTIVDLKSDLTRLRHQRKEFKCMLRLQKFCIVSQKLLVEKYKEIITHSHKQVNLKQDAATQQRMRSIEESTVLLNAKIEESAKHYRAIFPSKNMTTSCHSEASTSTTVTTTARAFHEERMQSINAKLVEDRDVNVCSEDCSRGEGEDEGDDVNVDEDELAQTLLGGSGDAGGVGAGGRGLEASLRARDERHLLSTSTLLQEADELVHSLSHTVGKVQGLYRSHSLSLPPEDQELDFESL